MSSKRPPQYVVTSAAGGDHGTPFAAFKRAENCARALGPGATIQTIHAPCQIWRIAADGSAELVRDDSA